MTGLFWTDELKQRVETLWVDHSATQICEVLAVDGVTVTRNAVVGVLHRMKLTMNQKSEVHPQTRQEPGQRRPIGPRPPALSVSFGGPSVDRVVVPELRCVETEPRNLTLLQLKKDDCRHIAGDDYLFCGHPKLKGSSYCPDHYHITRGPGTVVEKRASEMVRI